MEIQTIEQLRACFEALQAHAEHLYRVAELRQDPAAAALVREQWFRLRQGPVRALVLGVSSAGKSTVINAVAGEIVVPEGKQTTSPLPVWVRAAGEPMERPRIQMLKKEDIRPENCGRLDFLTDYCYTATEAGRGTGQEKFRELKAATVEADAGTLHSAGVTFIDTPGIGVSRGDNARVREVLAQGCEMLIIVFMDLHPQEVKDYFADLLVEETSPLRALLDTGRVFLVMNATDEKHADAYAVMDTREHLRQAFDGWDGEDRLFVFNALQARICACGIYTYEDLLPNGFADAEREDAAKAEQKEKEIAALAQPQEGLDALCDALGMAVWDLCACAEEVERLLRPIHEGLEAAVKLLEQPYLDRLREIREAQYPVPETLAKKRDKLQHRLHTLQEHRLDYGKRLSGTPEDAQTQWPGAELARRYRGQDRFADHRLMGATRDEADALMVELIRRDNGAELWQTLLRGKLAGLEQELKAALLDPKQNPELRFLQETVAQMKNFADTRTDDQGNRIIPEQDVLAFVTMADAVLAQAKTAGVRTLTGVTLTAGEREAIETFFREKQEKVRSGGLVQGWRLFWLYPDAAAVILSPLVDRLVFRGTEAFLEAYRQTLFGQLPGVKQQYMTMLTQACVAVGAALETVRQEILVETEAARAGDLAQVHRELAELELRCHGAAGETE